MATKKVRVSITEEKLKVVVKMVTAEAKAKEVALAIGILIKTAYR